jgi:hypothetical protein
VKILPVALLAMCLSASIPADALLAQPVDSAAGLPSPSDIKEFDRARVLAEAEEFIAKQPLTLTSFPTTRSAGGLHDYYSQADYFWPNPNNPNGPYVNRDGMTNPDNFLGHRHALMTFSIQEPALVSAYLLTQDEKYAHHAVDHLRAWFVNADTLLNPSLPYAQAVTGAQTGRSYGIIDTLHLCEVAQSILVLRKHAMLDAADDKVITQWFADYIQWLTTHPNGVAEGSAKNNHAVCYWLQVAMFAKVTGDEGMLAQCRKRYATQLLSQMAPDGSFPAELKRTKPYGYSIFNLDQLTMLCQALSTPEHNLWALTLPEGQSIGKGLEFLSPYVSDKSEWLKRPDTKPDVMYWDNWPVRSQTWLVAGLALKEPRYIALLKQLKPDYSMEEVARNLPIRQPVLWVE